MALKEWRNRKRYTDGQTKRLMENKDRDKGKRGLTGWELRTE